MASFLLFSACSLFNEKGLQARIYLPFPLNVDMCVRMFAFLCDGNRDRVVNWIVAVGSGLSNLYSLKTRG